MAGFGNLWANELAFLTGVSPWTPIGEVDVDRLVERGATMLRHSATVDGAYQVTTGSPVRGDDHWVTGRQRQGCRRCRGPISVTAEVPGDAAEPTYVVVPRVPAGTGPGGTGGIGARGAGQTRCSRRAASAIDPLIEG